MSKTVKTSERRNKHAQITYTEKEWIQLQNDFAQSSCTRLTQYLRDLTLKAPFDIYRNRSFDAFVEEISQLRKEMQEIAAQKPLTGLNEFRLLHLHKEIKESINKLIDLCMQK